QKLLSTIVRLDRERGQRYGAGQVIDILRGRRTARTERLGHDSLATRGIGAHPSANAWRGAVRRLLPLGRVASRGDHGALGLTDGSAEVLRGEREVQLRRERERTRARRPARARTAASDLDPVHAEVFEALRAWRAETAKAQQVPAY